jgi:hypothetical protein
MLLEKFQVGTLSDLGLKFSRDSHIASRVQAALRMFIRNIRKMWLRIQYTSKFKY